MPWRPNRDQELVHPDPNQTPKGVLEYSKATSELS